MNILGAEALSGGLVTRVEMCHNRGGREAL